MWIKAKEQRGQTLLFAIFRIFLKFFHTHIAYDTMKYIKNFSIVLFKKTSKKLYLQNLKNS